MTVAMKKEIHMTGQELMGMVQLRPGDIGKYAIVPGPKERMENLIKRLENPVKNFSFMEYHMYTGEFNGVKVTTINGGRFSADTAITTELLCCAQAQKMVRIGSCGAFREDIKIGDLIIVQGAIRGEGVTPYYVDNDFKTEADAELTSVLEEVARSAGRNVHKGKVWSTDAILRETREHVGRAIDQGAIAVDMVSSVFLTLAQLSKIPAAAILAVSDNVITGQMGFMDPNYYLAEGDLIKISLDLVNRLEGKS